MSKYRAKAIVVDGVRFHSQGEYARWRELQLLERAGEIRELERQVKYPLLASTEKGGEIIGHYVADFQYRSRAVGYLTVEDFKGFMTPLARWKIKHFEAQYNTPVTITGPAAKRKAA